MTRVLMLLKTTGLAYDDRVRKECLTLNKLGADICVGVLDDSNKAVSDSTSYGVPFHSVALISRKLFPRARGIIWKTIELYVRFAWILLRQKPDVLWIHDMTMSGMLPLAILLRHLGRLERIVWDQHELPPDGTWQSKLRRKMFVRAVSLCDAVLSANRERIDYLAEQIGESQTRHFHVLQNFPDDDFCNWPTSNVPEDLATWLQGSPYLLTQGGGDDDRRLEECCASVIRLRNVKLVVVGRYRERTLDRLRTRWREQFDATVHFTGMVPQRRVVDYIDHALASVVLYGNLSRNSLLCAPNRLYQAVARGVPVIAGCNPPLRHFIERTGAGVVLQSDGDDVGDLVDGMKRLMDDRATFAARARSSRHTFSWHTQGDTIAAVLEAPSEVEAN